MTLTGKETDILKDLKAQEELCIEKYERYEEEAKDPALKQIFAEIRRAEQTHLSTITRILNGEEVAMPSPPKSAASAKYAGETSPCSGRDKENDAYLCRDALSMEKRVSSVYNTGVFEFCSPILRDTLAHIEKEEQNHGEQLYSYLEKNGMYN
ncbi:MAG: spore coat protein [Clostridia bacterium]|nr:spore coat protein [Clostridia bacterium]